MTRHKCLMAIGFIVLLTMSAFGVMTKKEWVDAQADRHEVSTDLLVDRAYDRGQPTSFYLVVTNVPRDPFVVQSEKRAKQIGGWAGITTNDSLLQIDSKLTNWIESAAAAAKPARVYHSSSFWTAYYAVKVVDGGGNEYRTVTNIHGLYGKHAVESNGWATMTGDDIEAALRE